LTRQVGSSVAKSMLIRLHKMKSIKGYLSIIGLVLVMSCNGKDINTDCKGAAQELLCSFLINPMCGCDGVTYDNPCSAQAAGVKRTVPGKCGKN